MRWNPFRRGDDAAEPAESQFESTVVEDPARFLAAAHAAQVAHADAMVRSDAMARAAGADATLAGPSGDPGPDSGPRASAPMPLAPAAEPPGNMAEAPSIGHIGRYALKTVLGEGGLGTVYAAWDPLLSRTVALKTLHLDAAPADRPSLDSLFLNEARAAAGLSHPHIVTVFDAGPAETGVYIAMERLNGQDLRHLLQQGFRPSPVEAAQLVRRVADALAYAHRKGVVHCDIKPANIFMVGRMHPKVLDFGIARVAHRENNTTMEGVLAGSPYYLAPEQLDGRTVDRRSDVYSLGVVLYELLTGHRPFEGQTLEDIARAVRSDEVAPAHRVSPRVPLGLSVIAQRAMARQPEQRYPSARHLAMELRHWVESSEARALAGSGTRSRRRRRGMNQMLVALPFALAGLAAFGWWWGTQRSAPAASVPGALPAASVAMPVPPAASGLTTPIASSPVAVAAGATATATATASVAAAASAAATASAPASATVAGAASSVTRPRDKPSARTERRKAGASTPARPGEAEAPRAPPPPGVVQLALIPWGQVEVDGQQVGISPPLTRLQLPSGVHQIVVRNADFPPLSTTVTVTPDHPVSLRHRFGP